MNIVSHPKSCALRTLLVSVIASLLASLGWAQAQQYHAVYTGSPWYDNNGNVVNAHGGGIIPVGSTYYWFGEYKNSTNDFDAIGCYSSVDLQNWVFVNKVLVRQPSGDIGPNRVVERPKVLFCDKTGQFVMFMHVDNLNYNDESIGYATCSTVGGNYTYQGRLQFNGSRIRHWDMGTFKDADGTGYVLTQGGFAYKLAPDYLSAVNEVAHGMASGKEAPAMFKSGSTYFWVFSGKSAGKVMTTSTTRRHRSVELGQVGVTLRPQESRPGIRNQHSSFPLLGRAGQRLCTWGTVGRTPINPPPPTSGSL